MIKLFKTHTEQIEILKSRGLSISNDEYAIKILAHENYYALINGYKDLFIATTSPSDHYKPLATFKEILALYSFDRKLRELLLIELLRVERSIRTKIIYSFSEKYGYNHNAYLMPASFNIKGQINFNRASLLICSLNNLIEKYKTKHNAISHYVDKHGYVPLWVLSNVMTFGKLNSFYAAMLYPEKIDVAKEFNLTPNSFKPLVDILAEFRNKCAHGEKVYCYAKDRCISRPIPYLPLHSSLGIPVNQKGYKHGTEDVLAVLIALKPFMSAFRYKKLIDNISFSLQNKLAQRLKSISIDDVKDVMGLKGNWIELKNL